MKKTNQFIPVKRCSRCNSEMLVDVDTGLCWLCKKREELYFEIEYLRIAPEILAANRRIYGKDNFV